jgi:hypothetical protein
VVEAQNLRLDISWCHRDRVLSDRVAQSLDAADGGAEIPGGRDPNIAARTSASASPTATVGQSGLLRRSRSPASRTPTDHLAGGGVNRDASLSCRAPGSDVPAQHGRAVPGGWFGSAVRQHANCDGGPVAHNRRGNKFATVAAAADQHLAPTSRAHIEPGRHHAGIVASADITWTSAAIAAILTPHACPARCGARRRT